MAVSTFVLLMGGDSLSIGFLALVLRRELEAKLDPSVCPRERLLIKSLNSVNFFLT
jgi:hypothetical protein